MFFSSERSERRAGCFSPVAYYSLINDLVAKDSSKNPWIQAGGQKKTAGCLNPSLVATPGFAKRPFSGCCKLQTRKEVVK